MKEQLFNFFQVSTMYSTNNNTIIGCFRPPPPSSVKVADLTSFSRLSRGELRCSFYVSEVSVRRAAWTLALCTSPQWPLHDDPGVIYSGAEQYHELLMKNKLSRFHRCFKILLSVLYFE